MSMSFRSQATSGSVRDSSSSSPAVATKTRFPMVMEHIEAVVAVHKPPLPPAPKPVAAVAAVAVVPAAAAVTLLDVNRSALAGCLGGSLATLALHPLELLKTRQAVHCNGSESKARETYSSIARAVKSILNNEGGFKGLYSGVSANVIVAGLSWGIYFCA
jgi:hypothetical protein